MKKEEILEKIKGQAEEQRMESVEFNMLLFFGVFVAVMIMLICAGFHEKMWGFICAIVIIVLFIWFMFPILSSSRKKNTMLYRLVRWWISKTPSYTQEKMKWIAHELLQEKELLKVKLPKEKAEYLAELQEKIATIDAEYSQEEKVLTEEITKLETFLGNA
jgi:Ca2+/Na+ antiporter